MIGHMQQENSAKDKALFEPHQTAIGALIAGHAS